MAVVAVVAVVVVRGRRHRNKTSPFVTGNNVLLAATYKMSSRLDEDESRGHLGFIRDSNLGEHHLPVWEGQTWYRDGGVIYGTRSTPLSLPMNSEPDTESDFRVCAHWPTTNKMDPTKFIISHNCGYN